MEFGYNSTGYCSTELVLERLPENAILGRQAYHLVCPLGRSLLVAPFPLS